MSRRLVCLGLLLVCATTVGAQQAPSQNASPAAQQVQPVSEDQRIRAADIDKLLEDGKVVLLDVREPKELQELGTREGYINIPIADLEKRLNELPKDKAILTA